MDLYVIRVRPVWHWLCFWLGHKMRHESWSRWHCVRPGCTYAETRRA